MDELSFLDLPAGELDEKNSAPYVIAQTFFEDDKPYVGLYSEWRCDIDALNTYYNVFSFYKEDFPGSGYAGFQNINGGHIVIFSMWNTLLCNPRIEYSHPKSRVVEFGNEGTGISIRTRFDYKENNWYAMFMAVQERDGRTYYALNVKEMGGEWELIGQISYPMTNIGISYNCFFLEDFTYNGYSRCQTIRNMHAIKHDGSVISPKQIYLSHANSKLFRVHNQSLNCGYKSGENMISIFSGSRKINNEQTFPKWIDY